MSFYIHLGRNVDPVGFFSSLSVQKADDGGEWITINGNHVLIDAQGEHPEKGSFATRRARKGGVTPPHEHTWENPSKSVAILRHDTASHTIVRELKHHSGLERVPGGWKIVNPGSDRVVYHGSKEGSKQFLSQRYGVKDG